MQERKFPPQSDATVSMGTVKLVSDLLKGSTFVIKNDKLASSEIER